MGAAREDDLAGLSLQLVRVTDELPEGFGALRAEAEAEGHRHISRLAREFADQRPMFTAIFAAFADGELAGIGALTPEPEPSGRCAFRMRRLYVRAGLRRRGVARALTSALLQEALGEARLVTVHAGDAEAARFWEAQGFSAVSGLPWSHELDGGLHPVRH